MGNNKRMKYKLKAASTVMYEDNPKIKEALLKCPLVKEYGEDLYVNIEYLSNIQDLLDYINEDCYDEYGWKPEEVIINPKDMCITLYDYYIE